MAEDAEVDPIQFERVRDHHCSPFPVNPSIPNTMLAGNFRHIGISDVTR
jgi:hypothetical protein